MKVHKYDRKEWIVSILELNNRLQKENAKLTYENIKLKEKLTLTDVVESSDVLVVKFSDDEIKLMTTKEFEDYENECMEFDGFTGCIILGKLTKSS